MLNHKRHHFFRESLWPLLPSTFHHHCYTSCSTRSLSPPKSSYLMINTKERDSLFFLKEREKKGDWFWRRVWLVGMSKSTERNWFSLFHVLLFQGLVLWVWLVTGMPEMNILAPSGFGMNTNTCTCYCNIWTFTQYENIISHVSETSPKMTPGVTQYWYQCLVSSS